MDLATLQNSVGGELQRRSVWGESKVSKVRTPNPNTHLDDPGWQGSQERILEQAIRLMGPVYPDAVFKRLQSSDPGRAVRL